MPSSTPDAARIAELEQQVRALQHQVEARDLALAELAARLRLLEQGGPASVSDSRS